MKKILLFFAFFCLFLSSQTDVHATGEQYVEAFNGLVDGVNQRLAAARGPDFNGVLPVGGGLAGINTYNAQVTSYNTANSTNLVQLKTPGQPIGQGDLNVLRQRVIGLLGTFKNIPDPFDTTDPNAFSKFVNYTINGYMDGNILRDRGFTVVPGLYTSKGNTIYSSDFSNAPLLWIHFQELQTILNKMKNTATYGVNLVTTHGYAEWWMRQGAQTVEQILANYADPGKYTLTYSGSADYPGIMYGGGVTSLTAMAPIPINPFLTIEAHYYPTTEWHANLPAQSKRKTAKVYFLKRVKDYQRYSWVDQLQIGHLVIVNDTTDYNWLIWNTYSGSSAQEIIKTQPTTTGEIVCAAPHGIVDGYFTNFQSMASKTVLYTNFGYISEFDFKEIDITDPAGRDNVADGVLSTGCECSSCVPKIGKELEEMTRCPFVSIPLGFSSSNESLLRVKAYVHDYNVGSLRFQMYNLDTYACDYGIGSDPADNANTYSFAVVKRPSGMDVIFSLQGNAAGKPLNGFPYTIAKVNEDGNDYYKLSFKDDEMIEHKFHDSTLVEVSKIVDKKRVTLSGSGENGWPSFATNRNLPTGDKIVSVIGSRFNAFPTYAGAYMTKPIRYEDKQGNVLSLLSVETSSPQEGVTVTSIVDSDKNGTAVSKTAITDDLNTKTTTVEELDPASTDNNKIVLRKTETAEIFSDNGLTRTLTRTVSAQGNQSTEITAIKVFPWGEEVVSRTSPDGRTTTYVFYEDAANDGFNYSHLKQETCSDSTWSRYSYDAYGRILKVVSVFGNCTPDSPEANSRVVVNEYSQNDSDTRPYTVVTSVLGSEVSRSYNVYLTDRTLSIRCTVPGAASDDVSNLVTTSESYQSGAFAGRPRKITNPDGTISIYIYSLVGGILTTTVDSGAANGDTITDGTRSITLTNDGGNTISSSTVDIASGKTLSSASYTVDGLGRPTRIDYSDGTHTETVYGCCGPESQKDREGIVTLTTYDSLKRATSTTTAGISTIYSYDVLGNVTATTLKGTDGSEFTTSNVYNDAGQLVSTTDPMLRSTAYDENLITHVRTTTNPDGSTIITTANADGSTASVSGTAVHGVSYQYGVENGEMFTKVIPAGAEGQWTKSYTDFLGRNYKTVYADGTQSVTYYDSAGRPIKQVSAGHTTLTAYNAKGEAVKSAVDMNSNGAIDDGTDKVTQYDNIVTTAHGTDVRHQTVTQNNVVASVSESSVSGLSSWQSSFGRTSSSVTVLNGNGQKTVTATNPDGSTITQTYQNGRLMSSAHSVLGTTTYAYDGHGRLASQQATVNGQATTTSFTYDKVDRTVTVTDPAGRVTTNTYDNMGRLTSVSMPGNRTVNYTYAVTGELTSVSGSDTYPVNYSYDALGRMKTLTDGNGSATTWNYSADRGFMTSKAYADSSSVSYAYNPDGSVNTRTWARGIVTTYTYNAAGELTGVSYSGNSAPAVSFTRDFFGRPTSVTDGTGASTLAYNPDSTLVSAAVPYIANAAVNYSYDNLGRRTGMSLQNGGTSLSTASYTYDAMSRLASVGSAGVSPAVSASYTRISGSSLLATSTIGGLTTTRAYDNLNRLTSIGSAGVSPAISYSYTYNDHDQRSKATLADGSYWLYTYDQYGQVTSGKKYDASNAEIPNQQFGYAFDSIGNRISEDRNSNTFSYSKNNVNQYTQRTVPGKIDISGTAALAAKVTIERMSLGDTVAAFTKLTDRTSKYFSKDFTFDNSINPVSEDFRIFAVETALGKDTVSKQTVNVFLPKTPEAYSYDPDGNLTSDGRFTYSWDGENRLSSVSSLSSLSSRIKVEFAYDYMSRRVERKLYNWQDNAWNLTSDVKSVFDGMNVIAEFDAATNTMLKSYMWGLDLSGTLQGAGGVGGLVCARAGPDVYFPIFDGNGNAVAYLDASGNKVAEYEYSPDPKIIVKSGPKADELAEIASFSTKPYDKNLDAFIYPFRILKEGRWLSRDPLGEEGGENLYGFVQNNSINYFDSLGLETYRFVLGVGYGLGLEQWKTFWENTVKNKMKGKFKDGKNNICFDTVSATKENIGNELKDNNTYFFLVAHGSIFWKGDVVDNPLNPAGGIDENIAKQKNIEAAEIRALDIARLPFQKYGNDIESQTRRWRDAVKTWESANPNYRGAKPEKPVYPTADQFKGTISEDDLFLKILLADWKYYKPSEVPKNERLWWYGCHPFYMHNDTIQVSPSAYVNGVLSRRKFPILDIMNDKWLPSDVENIIRKNIKEPKIGE